MDFKSIRMLYEQSVAWQHVNHRTPFNQFIDHARNGKHAAVQKVLRLNRELHRMKVTYVNPPYRNQTISTLEQEFLEVATKMVGNAGTLLAVFKEAQRRQDPCSDWHKIHDLTRQSLIMKHNLTSEHNKANFILTY